MLASMAPSVALVRTETIPVHIERVKCEMNATTTLQCPRRVYAVIYDLFVALQLVLVGSQANRKHPCVVCWVICV